MISMITFETQLNSAPSEPNTFIFNLEYCKSSGELGISIINDIACRNELILSRLGKFIDDYYMDVELSMLSFKLVNILTGDSSFKNISALSKSDYTCLRLGSVSILGVYFM